MELLSVLVYDNKKREDRLDVAFKIAREAFKGTKLIMRDIDRAMKSVSRKAYGNKGGIKI